jgi:acyl-CoA synthetase (AMP-forming)/AMP-acid ligase II
VFIEENTYSIADTKLFSFVERKKDTLKISGVQVSPTEIEDVIRSHPAKLVTDVCVGGVSEGRISDEKNPRAWIVLSGEGKRLGDAETIRLLDEWTKNNLSSYKWVRAGFEVVDEVRCFSIHAMTPQLDLAD